MLLIFHGSKDFSCAKCTKLLDFVIFMKVYDISLSVSKVISCEQSSPIRGKNDSLITIKIFFYKNDKKNYLYILDTQNYMNVKNLSYYYWDNKLNQFQVCRSDINLRK